MRSVHRVGLALTAAFVLAVAGAPSAVAQADDGVEDMFVVTGRAEVRPDDRVDTVFIADGPVTVSGTVRDTVIALNGDVLVTGTVEDEVVAIDGRVLVGRTGHVGGDIVSRHRPVLREGGRFDGSWERWNAGAVRRGFAVASRVILWITFTVSTLILGLLLLLLFPRAAAATDLVARENRGAVAGWGLLMAIALPIVAVLLMVTLVGLPLGVGLLLALGLLYGIAYTTGAWLLGRTVAPRARPVLAFLAGWAILRVLAIIPVVGGLTWLVAVVAGFGTLTVAAHRARGRRAVPDRREPAVEPAGPAVV